MVVIGIPTFRRLGLLQKLIASLRPELRAGTAVIVADNDCSPDVQGAVEALTHPGVRFHYVPVEERGLSSVRNAIIESAFRLEPDWTWLAMLDDDGTVEPGWFDQIVSCGDRFDADLVGGTIRGSLPPGAGLFARHSVFAGRKNRPTGPVDRLNNTQNLMISRRLFDRMPRPAFSQDYNFSGGEDYEFFSRALRVGARMVWCGEACVEEPAPPDRLRPFQIMQRYYTTGLYMSRVDRTYDGFGHATTVAFKGLLSSSARLLMSIVSFDGSRFATNAMSISHYSGRVSGLFGLTSSRYASLESQ